MPGRRSNGDALSGCEDRTNDCAVLTGVPGPPAFGAYRDCSDVVHESGRGNAPRQKLRAQASWSCASEPSRSRFVCCLAPKGRASRKRIARVGARDGLRASSMSSYTALLSKSRSHGRVTRRHETEECPSRRGPPPRRVRLLDLTRATGLRTTGLMGEAPMSWTAWWVWLSLVGH
jgi:hypothetical protein